MTSKAKPSEENLEILHWHTCLSKSISLKIIYRKDRSRPVAIREYLDEVYRAPFKQGMKGPWQTHTKRFLRHKTLIQCARIAFGFSGIFDEDEAMRIVEGEVIEPDYPPVPPKREDFAFNFTLKDECGDDGETFDSADDFIDAAITYLALIDDLESMDEYLAQNHDALEHIGSSGDSELRQKFNVAMNDRKAELKGGDIAAGGYDPEGSE